MFIQITDESLTGKSIASTQIQAQNPIETVQDLIEARIYAEVERYNNETNAYFNGLVTPSETEITLNNTKSKKVRKKIDVEQQVYIALEAFQQNGFFILIDDQQVETLTQKIHVQETSKIAFVKLTPLIGG